jgi:hypothetical protein
MSYRVALPDGNIAEFPDDMPHDEAASIIKRQFYTPQEKPTSGLGSALSSGFRGGVGSAAEAAGEFSGLQGLAAFGKAQQEKAAQTYQPTSDKDIAAADTKGLLSGIGTRATQFLEPYAQAAGNIAGRFGAPMAAGAVAGALAPEAVIGGAGLSAMGLGTASALAGAGATALTDLPIEIGETQLERKKAGLPSDPVKDVAYGLAKTALNTFTGHLMSGPMRGLLGKTTVEQAELLAPKVLAGELTAADASKQLTGYAQNFLRGTAENAIVGTGMMVGNTALSRAATNQSLMSPEALAAYEESAKGAIALSPMFGAYHALGQKGLGEAKLTKDEADRNAALADIRNQQAANEQAKTEFQKTQPDYLDKVQSDYMATEQQKLDLLNQKRTVEAGSLTETADRLHNKDIDAKVKELQPTIESLATEFNKYRPAPPKVTEPTKVTETTPEQVAAQTAADRGEAPRDIESVDTAGLDKNNDYVSGLINDLNLTVEQREAITGNNLLARVGKLGLNQSDWVDIGSLPTFSKGKGGKGTSIADRVSNGEFDQWLPDKLKSEIIKDDTDKQQEAEEFIKDALRQHGLGQPFYDTETREALRQNEVEVTRIEQELDRESNIDEINGEIQDLADELAKEEHGNREPAEFGVEPEGEASGAAEGEGANAPETKLTEPAAEPSVEPAAEPATFEPKPIDISKLQDVLSRALLPTFKRFGLEDVGLKFIENAGNFDGEYTKKLIKIALDAERPLQALRHEAIHALKDMGFFTPGQWKLLENQADKVWIDKYLKNRNVDGKALKEGEESRFDAYSKLYKGDMDAIREEAIADAFADFDAHGAPKGIMATLTAKLQDFFAKVKQAFKSGGYESAEDVFKQIESGKLTATAEKPTATAGAKPSLRSNSIGGGEAGVQAADKTQAKPSLRTNTPEFKQFFGDSKLINEDGTPKVLYHGLAKDTVSFARKTERGSPIFLTDNPKFAEGFSKDSFAWMAAHADDVLTPQQLEKARKQAIAEIRKDYRRSPTAMKEMVDSLKTGEYAKATGEAQDYLRKAYKDMLQSGPHIMPLYVRAERPFDYENPEDVKAVLDEMNKSTDSYGLPAGRNYGGIKVGNWELIESKLVQDSIKKLGYDSFYVEEGGNKNLAVYDSKQLKSATGNVGAYGERPVTEAEAKPLGMTAEEANKAQAEGDVRLSLRRVESEIKSLPNGQAIYDAVRKRTTAREEQGYAERLIGGLGPTPFSYLRQKLLYQYNQLGVYGKRMVKEMGGAERLADVSAEAAALESNKAAGYVASALGTGNRMGGVPVYEKGYTKISNLNGTVKGVVEIFAPLAKYGDPEMYQAYQFWAMAKRGERLTKEGREKFTPDELAHAKELEKKYPEFVDIQKDWIKYNNGLVKYMIDTGVLSKEMGSEWMKYSDYVPFYRQLEGERTIGPQIMQNLTGVKPPKKLKGPKGEESAPAADFLETVTRNTQAAITSGLKNVAGQRAIDEAMFLGQAERVHNPQAAPNVLAILREGKTEHYVSADPLFIDAVKSLNLPELPFLSFLSKPADVLRSMVTKDPAFIIANMMKHSLYTYYTSGADISPITGTLKNFTDVMANKSPEYKTLLNAGVIGGYEFSRNIEASSQYLAKDLRAKTGTQEGLEKTFKPIAGIWQYLEHATEAHDAAVRISVYKDVLAKTGNEAEAIFRANEVLNFNRKGNSAMVRIVSAAIPFLNAKFQGLDLMYRGLVEPSLGGDVTARQKAVQKTGLIRAATLMGLSVMYAAMVTNDPDYEKQQQEVKDNNWIIPGLGVRIPIPFELGTMFKTMPEHIYRYFYGAEDVKELQAAGKKALMDLTFTPVPQVAMPVLEAEANYSFFTGRPIVGAHMAGIEPKFQVEPNTSIVAQKLGQMTNISPLKIDHIYQGYTGTMGMYLSDVVDSIFNTTSKPTNRFEQTPIIKRFLIDHEATGQVSQFYDLKNRVETAVKTINDLKSSGSPDLLEYAQEHGKEYAMRGQVQMVAKKLQVLKKQALQIRTSDINSDQKRDLLLENVRAQNATVGGIRQFKEALAE